MVAIETVCGFRFVPFGAVTTGDRAFSVLLLLSIIILSRLLFIRTD